MDKARATAGSTMILRQRAATLLLAAALAFSLVACKDSTLAQIAKTELAISSGCSAAFQVVSQANAQIPPLISTPDATAIINVLLRIEQANAQAIAATQQINTLNATGQANLLTILQPLDLAINNALSQGTLGITDPGTKQKVTLALTAVQTAIVSAETIIRTAKTQ